MPSFRKGLPAGLTEGKVPLKGGTDGLESGLTELYEFLTTVALTRLGGFNLRRVLRNCPNGLLNLVTCLALSGLGGSGAIGLGGSVATLALTGLGGSGATLALNAFGGSGTTVALTGLRGSGLSDRPY